MYNMYLSIKNTKEKISFPSPAFKAQERVEVAHAQLLIIPGSS